MEKLAIIGTGIAGMACAHYLRHRYKLAIYEKESWVGGHTNTVIVEEKGKPIAIDTGFMVYNEVTYPRLIEFFRKLEVPTQPTDMAFGVYEPGNSFYWCSNGFNGLFAQRQNAFKSFFWQMLRDVSRFNADARSLLDESENFRMSLGEFVKSRKYSNAFIKHYIVPMSAAIWSTPGDQMLEFPAQTLARFFHNHGLLGVKGHLPWRTVSGGSRSYRDKLIAPFRKDIRIGCAATGVERVPDGVWITDRAGNRERYDCAIIACHADQALQLISHPTYQENSLLSCFNYSRNEVLLHTDSSVMPPRQRAWASWNYRIEHDQTGREIASTHYWMNRLQKVSENQDYFVTVNHPDLVDPNKVLWHATYEHPTYDQAAMDAQARLPELNKDGPVYYCGSYFRYGFHEDALLSAENLCDHLMQNTPVS